MEFKSYIKKVEILIPPDFRPETQEIEYREDPLTGSKCLINTQRAERAKQAQRATAVSETITEGTKEGCFFCPEHIEIETPRFPASICATGRLKKGECTVFPNLFAFSEYHAVATLSQAHFLDLDQFTQQILVDNMLACQEWMIAVHSQNKHAKWPIYIWNHMPPSGASIVHPHTQTLVRETPTVMQEHMLAKSREHLSYNRLSFWHELIREEKDIGERCIYSNDSLALIASYAPRGFREIQFIFNDACSFTDLNETQMRDFAYTIVKVLEGYKQMGVGSFNLNMFSGPIGEETDHYSLNAKMISRPFPQGVYSSDTGPFERLQDEWVIEFLPEDVAEKMRGVFEAKA
ncbi:MAG: hypothetical protein GY845_13645 [Planctomycetes bacterium]|nr:hypothetical protein [Planctomycetota bacterium]